ncbi:GNAT family N-acetyltransferase [Paenibacillus sp. PAMC21692]|uniref:GNAT family N-acetyltransferase n=1 Tax=Paenibacillus sp. PAMC21692 TaxID=2762320 RepID=UPI00164D4E2F|nr:GNAT family N-acetyltransferase [Paenibacillus sp. PAMC21692]QNK57105.1 GNAT family N-acetyltransferase [Paenibacillus sp. PAMC21692]
MEIKIREIAADEYSEVVVLWNDVLGVHTVTDENFRVTMEQMIKAGNYKTFVALLENHVVGFISIVHGLAVGSENGYLHITGLAVRKEFQRHKVGTELLRYTENYAKDSRISSIILCTGMKRTNAHAFYEHNGYDKDSFCFDKIINLTNE